MLIDYVRVTPYIESLFTNQVPASILNTDGPRADYELGTLFQSSASGRISALRFWKESIETGIHTGGHIWDASGALLTSVAFLGETARGWQQQNLATPLPIVANTEYLASVNTGNTYYVATARGFATPIINGHLSSIVGGNARYGPPGQYLAQTFNANNYFRDVVFVVGTAVGVHAITTGAAGGRGRQQPAGMVTSEIVVLDRVEALIGVVGSEVEAAHES